MALPLTFRFMPSKKDYINASRTMTLQQKSIWLLFGILGFVGIMTAMPVLTDSSAISLSLKNWLNFLSCLTSFLPLVLFVLFISGSLFLLPSFQIGRQVQKNERLTAETEWQVNDDVLVIKNRFAETKMDWGTFRHTVVTKQYYLLVYTTNNRLAQILPKRAFESAEQENEFRDLLKRKGLIK